jgi:hypothetical protein
LLARVEVESFRLGSPAFADELVWREALKRLEPASKIVGVYKAAQMSSQLVVAVILVALDGGLFDGPVHSLHLPIGPRMVRLGQPMLDTVLAADLIEAMNPKAGRPAVAIARQIGELNAVVGEDRMEPIGHGCDQRFDEYNRCGTIGLLMQLNEGELRSSVDSNEQIELALLRPDFGNVDMKEAIG